MTTSNNHNFVEMLFEMNNHNINAINQIKSALIGIYKSLIRKFVRRPAGADNLRQGRKRCVRFLATRRVPRKTPSLRMHQQRLINSSRQVVLTVTLCWQFDNHTLLRNITRCSRWLCKGDNCEKYNTNASIHREVIHV